MSKLDEEIKKLCASPADYDRLIAAAKRLKKAENARLRREARNAIEAGEEPETPPGYYWRRAANGRYYLERERKFIL